MDRAGQPIVAVVREAVLDRDVLALDVAVWIPPGADADRALAALEQETGQAAAVAEAVPWGVRLAVGGEPCPPVERPAREADLRARCLRRLRAEGLLDGAGAPAGGTRGAAGDTRGAAGSTRGVAGSAQDPARDQESGPG